MSTQDRMAKLMLAAGGVLLLVLAIGNLARVIDTSPALEADARETGIYGDWRVSVSPALYDRAEYLFQVAYGYVHSDTLAAATIEAGDETADPTVIDERSDRAISLLEESLALAPGNAFAWETLAWAHGLAGDVSAAGQALAASRRLAPYNLDLALSRLTLELMLRDIDALLAELDLPEDLPAEEIAPPGAHAEDLAVIRRFAPGYYATIIERFPDLAESGDDDAKDG